MPPAAGGAVGGARSTTTWPIAAPGTLSAAATAEVVLLRIWVQFRPPSADWKTPCPLIPAYRIRARRRELRSSTRERASPEGVPAPRVQSSPPLTDRHTPVEAAR